MSAYMDEVFSQSNYRAAILAQRDALTIKFKSRLIYSTNGGMFRITPEFIAYVKAMVDLDYEALPLLDKNDLPVYVTDPKDFLRKIVGFYAEAVNDYFHDFEKLRAARKTISVVEAADTPTDPV